MLYHRWEVVVKQISLIVVIAAMFLTFVPAGSSYALQGEISIARVGCLYQRDTLLTGGRPRFVLKFLNNTGEKVDISNGFRLWSPDGAIWDSVTIDTVGYDFGGPSTIRGYFDITFDLRRNSWGSWPPTDTVSVLGSGTQVNPEKQLPNGFNDTALAITVFAPASDVINDQKHICIDTCFYAPYGTWTWVGQSLTQYYPKFLAPTGITYQPGAGYCYMFYHLPCGTVPGPNKTASEASSIDCVSCLRCCRGYTGNVNMTGLVDLADLSALVSYLTGGGYVLPCEGEANVNAMGIVDLADLSALVGLLTGSGYVLPVCGI
jgi:hypothetical protein